jgi:hypothetical protein
MFFFSNMKLGRLGLVEYVFPTYGVVC